MKYLTYVLSFVIILLFYNCEKCEIENRIELMPITRTFLPDIEGKTIVFVDSLGNEMTFIAGTLEVLEGFSSINIECKNGTIEEHSAVFEYNLLRTTTPDKTIEMTYQLGLGFGTALNEPTKLSDALITNVIFPSKSESLIIITSNRITDITDFSGYLGWVADTTLLGKTFYEVYQNTPHDKASAILYNKEFGIVSFRDEAYKLWIYDRIE